MTSASGPQSPVTGGATELAASLDPAIIIERYAAIGVDVRKYFIGIEAVQVFRCKDTGYRFYYPPQLAGEAEFYGELEHPDRRNMDGESPDYRRWGEDYQYALERIAPGERLLDVGCGYGYFLERAREKADVMGIDGNPHAESRCAAKNIPFRLGSISDHAEELRSTFDTVTAFQVLEHVYDVRQFVTSALEVLKPGGRLIFAVPNNVPYIRRFEVYNALNLPPHHMGLWNLDSLERMGRHFGLRITDHDYSEVSGRWVVEAYLHAAYLAGVTTEIHKHSFPEKAKMLAMAPFTVPASLIHYLRSGGVSTRNVISVELRRAD